MVDGGRSMAEKKVSKLSKKAQKELNNQQRNYWPVKPVTRIVPSGKVYSRKGRCKREED